MASTVVAAPPKNVSNAERIAAASATGSVLGGLVVWPPVVTDVTDELDDVTGIDGTEPEVAGFVVAGFVVAGLDTVTGSDGAVDSCCDDDFRQPVSETAANTVANKIASTNVSAPGTAGDTAAIGRLARTLRESTE